MTKQDPVPDSLDVPVDQLTLWIGWLVGLILLAGNLIVLTAKIGLSPSLFIDPPSLLIVLGGVAVATFIAYPFQAVTRIVPYVFYKEERMSPSEWELGSRIFGFAAKVSVPVGLLGTLIGIMVMLASLSATGDLQSIPFKNLSAGIAVASVTTFYSILLSVFVLWPLSHRIGCKAERAARLEREKEKTGGPAAAPDNGAPS